MTNFKVGDLVQVIKPTFRKSSHAYLKEDVDYYVVSIHEWPEGAGRSAGNEKVSVLCAKRVKKGDTKEPEQYWVDDECIEVVSVSEDEVNAAIESIVSARR